MRAASLALAGLSRDTACMAKRSFRHKPTKHRRRRRKLKMTKEAKARRRRYRMNKKHGPSRRKRTYRSTPRHTAIARANEQFFAASPTRKSEWLFEWDGGGYHSVEAANREEALKEMHAKAANFNRPYHGKVMTRKLIPLANTLHKAAPGEVSRWSSMWD